MNLNLHFLEAEGSLALWREVLSTQASDVCRRISAAAPAEFHNRPVDAVIQYLPDGAIPELGMGGSCFRRGLVTISLDPDSEYFEDRLANGEFRQLLAHELHHSMRFGTRGYGCSLGEALISEGLADSFAQKLTGGRLPIWSDSIADRDWADVLVRVERELEREDYDHAVWFFGTGDLPRWAGYTIGYRLVRLYEKLHSAEAFSAMVDIPHSQILATVWDALKGDTLR